MCDVLACSDGECLKDGVKDWLFKRSTKLNEIKRVSQSMRANEMLKLTAEKREEDGMGEWERGTLEGKSVDLRW